MRNHKTSRRTWIIGLLLLTLLSGGVWIYSSVRPVLEYRDEYQEGVRLIASLMVEPPVNPGDLEWNQVVNHLQGGYGNIYAPYGSDRSASIAEIKQYRIEFVARMQSGPPRSIENLKWAWNRMGDSCPLGRQYVDRFQDQFEENLNIAKLAMRPDSG